MKVIWRSHVDIADIIDVFEFSEMQDFCNTNWLCLIFAQARK